MSRLRWSTGLAAQAWVRFSLSAGTDLEHDHDFPEWFWIESGRMRHDCDGHSEILSLGDLVLLHPRHRHRIVPLDGPASHAVCSVEPACFNRIAARHRDHLWPWPLAGAGPVRRHLGPRALGRMRALFDLLPVRDQSPADAELAVTGTLRVLRDAPAEHHDGPPAWLATAVAELDDPQRAALGVTAFIAACQRAPATVCRACRRHYHLRPGELVTAARLDHCARALRCTDTSIEALAEAAGYASLSHFYRSFQARFGCPPGRYRTSP
ncbi:MAG: AraC family transcriptional regulator [Planctomycetota bacterium]|jgi:AraC-like DNA-binding protein|nr:AraC family transcriptional regulator [Planctomycetota bacterium]